MFALSVQCSGYLFVCIAVCGLCLEKREKKREDLEEGRAGSSFIFSAWILQKVISHNNRISALFARHIFPSGLWSVPPSVRSPKKCPRQTTLSATVTNMPYPLSEDVLGIHNSHFLMSTIFMQQWNKASEDENPPAKIAINVCWTSDLKVQTSWFDILSNAFQNVETSVFSFSWLKALGPCCSAVLIIKNWTMQCIIHMEQNEAFHSIRWKPENTFPMYRHWTHCNRVSLLSND